MRPRAALLLIMLATATVATTAASGQAAAPHSVALPAGATAAKQLPFDTVQFSFERPLLDPPRWSFEVSSDGHGRYTAQPLAAEPGMPARASEISVTPATLALLASGMGRLAAGTPCETKAKHLAQTGNKKLTYGRGPVQMSCAFNYADDDHVNAVAAAFQAMSETMKAGERLKHNHRYDRLGLDAELDGMVAQAKEHRLLELQNIAPILESIARDEELMSPSRRKAEALLKMASS